MTITYRLVKGSPLTHEELDANFTDLDTRLDTAEGTVSTLVSDVAGKQATLVSGTNIKTINGTSLLGSGDLAIVSQQTEYVTASFPGTGAVTTGKARWYPPANCTLVSIYASAGVAPTASAVFDMKKNGTSAGSATISSGQNKSAVGVLNVAMTTSDYLTVDISSITGGEAFTVVIGYEVA